MEHVLELTPEQHKAMVFDFVARQNAAWGTDVDPEKVWVELSEMLEGIAE